ncbi:uncharacterized protein LOC131630539 [Vicia villosa]|uniref:uncharacterized protein LOC131630539 n=1 Tax=Vicia villosa TaxID=3911 RepID=UPI00273C159C|nr:uncharacterized protein LOC131630539 [Vicia villosa]
MEKGLRQGDVVSPFLLALIAEGLAKLMSKDVELGVFKGFKVHVDVEFQLLQFADNTILIGEGSWSNLRSIKAFLHGFELMTSLSINLCKSNLVGNFLEAASTYLCCKRGTISFNFLGIPIRSNHRHQYIWKLVVDNFKKILSLWRDKFLLIGG